MSGILATESIRDGVFGLFRWMHAHKIDVVVLPEMGQDRNHEAASVLASDLQLWLGDMGFKLATAQYNDPCPRRDTHMLGMIVRENCLVGDITAIPLGASIEERRRNVGRSALRCTLRDPSTGKEGPLIDVIGVHLDDRRKRTRLGQLATLFRRIRRNRRTIVVGDYNADHGTALIDPLLRCWGWIMQAVPAAEPGTPAPPLFSLEWPRWAKGRVASVAQRLGGMASREVMKQLAENGFTDADPKHRPTMCAGNVPIVQLDRVAMSSGMVADSFSVDQVMPGDHRAIVAQLRVVPLPGENVAA